MRIAADAEFCEHCGAKVGPHRHVPWWHLHRRIYNWTLAWAYRPSAAVALFVLSFTESSFFPIPPDVLLMPLVLGNRKRWIRYASICSLASVLGAVLGFGIGMFLWGQVGEFFHDNVPGFGRDKIVLIARPDEPIEGFVDRDSLDLKGLGGVSLTDPIRLVRLDGGETVIPLADVDVETARSAPSLGSGSSTSSTTSGSSLRRDSRPCRSRSSRLRRACSARANRSRTHCCSLQCS